ncbi:hypothetical protein H0H92_013173 [Tricholoma furcatifolium]|nr:hypothetical protein H0H92_013173 [Tricholoma furcatifolium]
MYITLSSPSRLTASTGHVKVGTADEVHVEYTRFFADATVTQLCDAVEPTAIIVPYPAHAQCPSVTVRVMKADMAGDEASINDESSPSSTPPHSSRRLTALQSRSITKRLVAIAKSRPGFTELVQVQTLS